MISANVLTHEAADSSAEKYFRRLVARFHKTLPKIRRIEVAELLEQAWVDGQLDSAAERLAVARPDLYDEIKKARQDLESDQV